MMLTHGGPTRTAYVFGRRAGLLRILATLEARLRDTGYDESLAVHVRDAERAGHGPVADLYTRTARIGSHDGRACIRVRACTESRLRVLRSITVVASDLGETVEVAS